MFDVLCDCDCTAAARFRVEMKTGALYMCSHHRRENFAALEAGGVQAIVPLYNL